MAPKTEPATSTELAPISNIRRTILLVSAAFIAVCGLVIFGFTTTIEQAELPVDRINNATAVVANTLKYEVPVYLDVPNSQEHLVSALQSSFDQLLAQDHPSLHNWGLQFRRGSADDSEDYVVDLKDGDSVKYLASPFSKRVSIQVDPSVKHGDNLVTLIQKVLATEVFAAEIARFSSKDRSSVQLPYAPHYNAVFSLFTESGRPIDWDTDAALAPFHAIFDDLRPYANFSVSTQVQYYSKLADGVKLHPDNNGGLQVRQADLATFINFGDWNLFSHDIAPTINFVVYVPEAAYSATPVTIEGSKSNSFMVPQWGGVHVWSHPVDPQTPQIDPQALAATMETFASQLVMLLGMDQHPKSVSMRVGQLFRTQSRANLEQATDNLRSLVTVVNSLNDIAIPTVTAEYAKSALRHIRYAVAAIAAGDWAQAMTLSSEAVVASNAAFFEKEMVQQAYFPSEHKMAVYLPLLGPVGSIIVFALLKLLVEAKRKAKSEKKDI
ncbi:GPI transamidase component Gpi17p [Diutina catenulata]